MVEPNKRLETWLNRATDRMNKGKWTITQKLKGSNKPYLVGWVKDYVYSCENPEYLHMILKIKASPKWPEKTKYVYKLFYMTTRAKDGQVVNGQRPPVMGDGCYRTLMERAKEHRFF